MFKLTGRILLPALIMLAIACNASGQNRIGIFAGPQTSWAKYSVRGLLQKTTQKYGFHAGGMLKIPFENRLYFAPAIYYSMKGYEVTLLESAYPPSNLAVNNSLRVHTVEVSPLLQFDFSNDPSHFFVRLGPSLDFVITGNERFEENDGTIVERKMPVGNEHYGMVAASAFLHAGYEHANNWFAYAQYGHGMGSANNSDGGPRIRHRLLGLTIGRYLK